MCIVRFARLTKTSTGSEACLHCIQRENVEPFVVPADLEDWLSLSNGPTDPSCDNALLRPRVDDYARRQLQEEAGYENLSAEECVKLNKTQPKPNQQLDALSICK